MNKWIYPLLLVAPEAYDGLVQKATATMKCLFNGGIEG
jgi:hypothetical protein